MTPEWRARTLRRPSYRPELDLVAVAPDGRLAGFCVGWLAAERRRVQIEPLGVDPAFQGRGLSQALMGELFARAYVLDAEQAVVETESNRSAARHAYEAAGFRPLYRSLRKGRWFTEQNRT